MSCRFLFFSMKITFIMENEGNKIIEEMVKLRWGSRGEVVKFMLAGFVSLFGMVLLGLSFESFGEYVT